MRRGVPYDNSDPGLAPEATICRDTTSQLSSFEDGQSNRTINPYEGSGAERTLYLDESTTPVSIDQGFYEVPRNANTSLFLLLPSAESDVRRRASFNGEVHPQDLNDPNFKEFNLTNFPTELQRWQKTPEPLTKNHSHTETGGLTLYQKFFTLHPTLVSSKTLNYLEAAGDDEDFEVVNSFKLYIREREELVDAKNMLYQKVKAIEAEIGEMNNLIEEIMEDKRAKTEELSKVIMEQSAVISNLNKIDSQVIHIRDNIMGIKKNEKLGPLMEEHDDEDSSPLREPSIEVIKGHSDRITCIDFNIESGKVASGSVDKTLKIWNLTNNECLCTLSGHFDVVKTLQIMDNTVISGSNDRTIRQWDLSKVINEPTDANIKSTCVQTFRGHLGKVTCLMFDRRWLLSGSYDGTIRQWDLEYGKLISIMGNYQDFANIDPDLPNLVDMYDNYKSIWSTEPKKKIIQNDKASVFDNTQNYHQHRSLDMQETSPVNSLQFCGPALVSAHDDGTVRLWDIRSRVCHDTLFGHLGPIQTLKLDMSSIVTGGADGTIRTWDLRRKDQSGMFELWYGVKSISIDSWRIIAAVKNINVKFCHRISGVVKSLHGNTCVQEAIKHIEDTMVSGGEDGNILVWKL